jgi:hypothetical protein
VITELRVFTEEGMRKFDDVFSMEPEDRPARAKQLAKSSSYTEVIASNLQIPMPASRLEFARKMDEIAQNDPRVASLIHNSNLWSWIAAASMETLVAAGFEVKNKKRWLHTPGSITEYRHMFSSAFLSYHSHKSNPAAAMAVLCQPLGVFGEILEQVLATRALAGSIGAELATELYFDKTSQDLKSGSGGKGPGSPRRLVAFLNQIRLTVDIKSMTLQELVDLLPGEFARFR